MPAVLGEFEFDACRNLIGFRQGLGGQKRIVAGVEHQRRDADAVQPGFARGTAPVVVRAGKAVQRDGHQVVEFVNALDPVQSPSVNESGKAFQPRRGGGFERAQKVLGVDAVEAASEGVAADRKIQRCADGGGGKSWVTLCG